MNALILAVLIVLTPVLAHAKILNVEFKFTPYTGQPAKADHVETVPGTAALFLNNVPYAQQTVRQESVPVIFEEREIAPAVWIPVDSLGPVVRKGKNTIRIEFTPTSEQADYRAQLSWRTVTDQEINSDAGSKHTSTNTQAAGREEKAGKGKLVFEREFSADFVADEPWHHFPAVASVSDEDKQTLTALVMERGVAFKPDFKGVYKALEGVKRLAVDKIKKAKCVEAAYAAGLRLDAPAADQLEFFTTGNPEVVIRRRGGDLFMPSNPSALEKIKGDEAQMCAGIALSMAFPPKLVVVRAPDGVWRIAY